ncbi:MAG TPA: histidine kinase dimerization/phospho-acceptor domain-containing protein [Candidatus Angelobacter sp.]|nr:histidine kinase dimerization/phospho-acceptor domain-containing protein [Candidatus Angelobacter sp.]
MQDYRVILITDDAGFARSLKTLWRTEQALPSLQAITTDDLNEIGEGHLDVVIVGPVRNKRLASVLKLVDNGERPVICIVQASGEVKALKAERPRVLAISQHEGWIDAALLLVLECLKRLDVTSRLRRAEQAALASSRGAALGRYMAESRHDLNNSLTSVLGNAELLLLDSGQLPESARDQLRTIHEMALHMHQIMQRFSSSEMRALEKMSQDETGRPSQIPLPAL